MDLNNLVAGRILRSIGFDKEGTLIVNEGKLKRRKNETREG